MSPPVAPPTQYAQITYQYPRFYAPMQLAHHAHFYDKP